jgi:hypothetical protein
VGNSLREINRQMTVLREKNTNQALEIQLLNTKLRTAAEVKGVSVDDLTAAMESTPTKTTSSHLYYPGDGWTRQQSGSTL